MLLGVWVIVFLFLGFPQGWQKILAIATGLYLIVLGYSLSSDAPKTTDLRVPFVEHKAIVEEKKIETPAKVSPDPEVYSNTDQPVI